MIIDTHTHLNDDELYKNYKEVISRAKDAGVTRFFVVSWDKESSLKAIKIAEEFDECYAIIGYHPCNIENVSDEEYKSVITLLTHKKVIAVGEIGLDYYWVKEDDKREEQRKWFIKQINTANEYELPISIHCRDAIDDCLKILKKHPVKRGGVMHCYSGSAEYMKEFIKLGFYISLGGPVTFKNAKTPKEVAIETPFDKLLVETDAPYLTPHPYRGTLNEPKYTALVVKEIANLRNISEEEVCKQTSENALRLFYKAK